MFNLDHAIREWRRQMLAAGVKSPEVLDELESHLRDDVEQGIGSGLSVQDAFGVAVERIGKAGVIQEEFAKVGQIMSARERRVTWILCAVCAVLDGLIGVACLLAPGPSAIHERMLGAVAWFLFPAILWSWRLAWRLLPVIPGKPMRLFVAVLSGVVGGLCTAMLLHFFPASDRAIGLFDDAVLWAFVPAVVGVTLLFGLEEAAYRKLAIPES